MNYQRVADGISYHIAFEPSSEADIELWKGEVASIGSSLHHIGLIDAFEVFVKYSKIERRHLRGFRTSGRRTR